MSPRTRSVDTVKVSGVVGGIAGLFTSLLIVAATRVVFISDYRNCNSVVPVHRVAHATHQRHTFRPRRRKGRKRRDQIDLNEADDDRVEVQYYLVVSPPFSGVQWPNRGKILDTVETSF